MHSIKKILANRQIKLGNQYFNQNNYQSAVDCYIKSLRCLPTVTAFINYIKLEEFIGDLQTALSLASQFIEYFSKNINPYILRGHLYKKSKKFVQAISDFKYANSLTNDVASKCYINMNIGECYDKLGEIDNAINAFKSIIADNKNDVKARLLLGNVLMKNANYSKAKTEYTIAININPQIPVLYYNRAHCMILSNEWNKKRNKMLAPNIQENINHTIKSDLHKSVSLDPRFNKYVSKLQNKMGVGNTNIIKLKSGENPTKILNHMIGLKDVKREIRQYILDAKIQIRSNNSRRETMNLVFEGNPGSGKTQVANLIPKILYQNHVLQKPVFESIKGSSLVSKWQGESGTNMSDAIHNALGGVLFIDEAYDLMPKGNDDEGRKSIITELLQGAEDYRGCIVIILAGYPRQMENFLDYSNPGMRSRFNHVINFPDYTASELYQIFLLQLLHSKNIIKAPDLIYIRKHIKNALELMHSRDLPSGNGRLPRQLLDFMNDSKRSRLADKYDIEYITSHPNLYHIFTHQDIVQGFNQFYQNEHIRPNRSSNRNNLSSNSNENAYDELQHMIGLKSVKSKINSFIDNVKVAKFFGNGTVNLGNMNMIFEGAPGTGKTQVARLIAKILAQKGILKKPKLIECSAKDLVGKYVGQTAPKTAKVVKNAFGGVLFIDEAYELASDANSGNDYNAQAITTLIQLMENHRQELLVIMAGYTQQMEDFLNNSNPGLNSRFPNKILFPNYNSKEMYQIMMLHASNPKRHCIFTNSSKSMALFEMKDFVTLIKDLGIPLGNGRDARVILQSIIQSRNQRIVKNMSVYKHNKKKAEIITPDDVRHGFKSVGDSKQLEG